MKLNKQIAIVTGGASGFGAGIVKKFAEEGAIVVIADLNIELATSLADEIGDNSLAIEVDVANGESVKSMVDNVMEKYGTIDIVVNNAGIGHIPQPLDE